MDLTSKSSVLSDHRLFKFFLLNNYSINFKSQGSRAQLRQTLIANMVTSNESTTSKKSIRAYDRNKVKVFCNKKLVMLFVELLNQPLLRSSDI